MTQKPSKDGIEESVPVKKVTGYGIPTKDKEVPKLPEKPEDLPVDVKEWLDDSTG